MKKEFYLTQFQLSILESLNELRLLSSELQILEYKLQLENDPAVKQKHEAINKRAKQPLQTITIPVWHNNQKKEDDGRFYWNASSNLPSFSTQHLTGLTYSQIQEEARLRVFQPGFGQPTQTMEESTDIIMHKMHQETQKQAENKKDKSVILRFLIHNLIRIQRMRRCRIGRIQRKGPGTTGKTRMKRAVEIKCADYVIFSAFIGCFSLNFRSHGAIATYCF